MSKHHWNVTLQREDGEIVQYPISVGWDPTREDASNAVANAAKAELNYKTGKQHAPISASLIEGSEAMAA